MRRLTLGRTKDEVTAELEAMGATNVLISAPCIADRKLARPHWGSCGLGEDAAVHGQVDDGCPDPTDHHRYVSGPWTVSFVSGPWTVSFIYRGGTDGHP